MLPVPNHRDTFGEGEVTPRSPQLPSPLRQPQPRAVPAAGGGGCSGGGSDDDSGDNEADQKEERSSERTRRGGSCVLRAYTRSP